MKNTLLISATIILSLGFFSKSPGDEIPLSPPLLSAVPMNFEEELQAGENTDLLVQLTNIGREPINWHGEVNLSPVNNRDRLNRGSRPILDNQPGPQRDNPGDVLERHQVPYIYTCGMVWDGECMWGTSYQNDRLFAINPEDDAVIDDFQTCNSPRGLAFDGENLYINRGDQDRSRIFIYSRAGDLVDYFDLPYRIQGMTIDENERLFVNDFDSQVIHVIDLENREELSAFSILNALQFENHSVGALLWVKEHRPGQLWMAVRDNRTNEDFACQVTLDGDFHSEELERFPFEEESLYAIAHDGRNLWHSGRYEQQLWWVYDDGVAEHQFATIEPESGLIDVNEEVEIIINIDAQNQFEGIYRGFLEISVDDPDVPALQIGINISVDGVPEIEVVRDNGPVRNMINWNDCFNSIYVEETYSIPIIIRNTGTAQLEIENIRFNLENFLTSHINLSLPPRSWQLVNLGFNTQETGAYHGTLSISSNDPNGREIAIAVAAIAQTPPQVAVDPVMIFDVLPIGIRSEIALNISNEGDGELDWKAEFENSDLLLRDNPEIQGSGPQRCVRQVETEPGSNDANPDYPYRDTVGEILRVYNVPYRDTRGLAWDGELMWGIAWNENRLYAVDPTTGIIRRNIEIHELPRALTWDGNNFYIGDVNLRIIYVYNRQGDMLDNLNFGFEFDGIASNQHNYLYLNNREDNRIHVIDVERRIEIGIVEYSGLIGGDDIDCIEWVPNHFSGKLWCLSRNHVYQLNVLENWDAELVNDFDWNADQKYSGLAHDGENLWHGMRGEMLWYKHDDGITEVIWAEAQPDSGSLMGHLDEDMFIILNSTRLIGGVYNAILHLLTNDVDNRDLMIPINLQVNGIPDLSISWEFGMDNNVIDWNDYQAGIFSGGTYNVPIRFTNPGNDLIIIEDIFSDNGAFRAEPNQLSIIPGDTVICDFVFCPDDVGVWEAEMIVVSNAPDAEEISIDLVGESSPPPVMQVEQGRIEEEIQILENSIQVVNISNTGESTLIWETWLEFPNVDFREIPQAVERDNIGNRLIESRGPNTPNRDDPGDILQQLETPYGNTTGLAWDGDLMWGVDNTENRLYAIDIDTRMLVFDFEIHDQPKGLAFDGLNLLVGGDGEIYKYDRTGNLLSQHRPIVSPDGIACDGRRFIFVKNGLDPDIHVLRIEDFEEVTTINCGEVFDDFSFQSISWVDLHFEGQLWCITVNHIWQLYIDENWQPEVFNDFESVVDQEYAGIAHNGVNIVHGMSNQRMWVVCDDGIDEIPWVTVNNSSGELAPDSETEIQLMFDASRFMGGNYSTILHILSNAPENLDETVEIQLTITGNPQITTIPIAAPLEGNTEIQFSDALVNEAPSLKRVVLKNTGTNELEIQRIASDNNEFFPVNPEELLIAIRDSVAIEFEFRPIEVGRREGRISIFTNAENFEDGLLWFDLVGNGVTHSIVSTTPDENSHISVPIQMFEEDLTRSLVIRNSGGNNSVDLEYSILPLTVDWENDRDRGPNFSHRRKIRSLFERESSPERDLPGDIINELGIPFLGTSGLAWDGELIWGVVTETDRLIAVNPADARIAHNFGILEDPHCLAYDGTHFYFSVNLDNAIVKCDRDGNIINIIEMPFADIHGLAIDSYGNLLIASGPESVVRIFELLNFNEIANFELGNLVNADLGSIEWVPDHPDGQLYAVSPDRIYQFYLDQDWIPELVGEISVDINLLSAGLTHDGNDLWLGLNNIESWLLIDDGVSEISVDPWIMINPDRGTIRPGDNTNVILQFSARNLESATEYRSEILIRTNDPDNPAIVIPVSMITESLPEHFQGIRETNSFHNIRISELSFNNEPVPDGIEVGVFTPDNILAGAIVWFSERAEPMNLRAYRDDVNTEIIEGFEQGEQFTFRIWDNENDSEWEHFEVAYEEGNDFWEWRGNSLISIQGASEKDLTIELNAGWNMISLNVIPPDDFWLIGNNGERLFDGPDVIRMIEQFRYVNENNEVQHHVSILKNGDGLFYMPNWDFNNIPYWNLEGGFQICIDSPLTANWSGFRIPSDAPISLNSGWNLIAYYPEYDLDASAPDFYVLSPIIENVRIAKNSDGQFLTTAQGFSNMQPWQEKNGYLVYIVSDEPVVLNYPPEQELIAVNNDYNQFAYKNTGNSSGQNLPVRTGQNMSVLINSVSGQELQKNDLIEAYNLSGNLLVGKGVVDVEGRCGVAVWGDDPVTETVDGLLENELFVLKLQRLLEPESRIELQITKAVNETEDGEQSGKELVYKTDSFVVVETSLQSPVPVDFYLSQNFPNPFNSSTSIKYGLPQSEIVRFDLFDVAGRHVECILNKKLSAGHHSINWDGKARSSGVYILRMRSGNFKSVKKVTLVK